jgi:hypothetical protein
MMNLEVDVSIAETEIVDQIPRTYFYGIRQMNRRDGSLIVKINLAKFKALTASAIHHCLIAWATGKFRVPPEFGPGGGEQLKCDTRNIKHTSNNPCTDILCCRDADFC